MPKLLIRPSLLAIAIALAATPLAPLAQADTNATTAGVRRFDIPAGDLGETLSRIAHETGQLLSVNPWLIESKHAPAVRGQFSAEQAVNQALNGSGLSLGTTASGAYTVLPSSAQNLPATTINASAADFAADTLASDNGFVAHRSSSATKTDTALLETPQSISVVSRAGVGAVRPECPRRDDQPGDQASDRRAAA